MRGVGYSADPAHLESQMTSCDATAGEAGASHPKNRRGGTTLKRMIAAAIGAAALAGLAGCASHMEQAAACEDAARRIYVLAVAGQDLSGAKRPAQCDGLSDAEVEAIGEKVIGDMLRASFGSKS